MGVKHHSPAVINVGIILKGTAIQTNLLASLCDTLSIKESEHVELEEALSHIGLRHEIDLEELSL